MATNSFQDKLDTKVWRTKGARFNAYRRVLRRHNILTWVTSFSSVHLLIVSIVQLVPMVNISPQQNTSLSLISITLSLIILVYGLIEGGKQYGLQAERFHACGLDLSRIYDKLLASNGDEKVVLSIALEYSDVLQRYSLNHEVIDDLYFRLQNKQEFKELEDRNCISRMLIWFSFNYTAVALAICATVLPLFLTIAVIHG